MKVTIDEYLKGRDVDFPLSEEQWRNMCELLVSINRLRDIWNKPMTISSGYRPASFNAAAGGSKQSAHLTCEAIDIHDPKQELSTFLRNDEPLLKELGLYMEHPHHTPTWCHLQIRPTRTRIFIP